LKVVAIANSNATSHFVELHSSYVLPLTPHRLSGFSCDVVYYLLFASLEGVKLKAAWLAVLLCHLYPPHRIDDLLLVLSIFIECSQHINYTC